MCEEPQSRRAGARITGAVSGKEAAFESEPRQEQGGPGRRVHIPWVLDDLPERRQYTPDTSTGDASTTPRKSARGDRPPRGRGQSIESVIKQLKPILRGWYNYYRFAQTAWSFSGPDGYVRRRLRWLCWRHWKTPRTRRKRPIALGLRPDKARKTAYSNCGPWRCSRLPGVHQALSNSHPRVRPLTGSLKGDFRVRTGGWRILLTPNRESRVLHSYAILPRGDAY